MRLRSRLLMFIALPAGCGQSSDESTAAERAVLDRNLFELPAAEFNEAKVMMTIFDVRTVYE